jgi:hypothetical protein
MLLRAPFREVKVKGRCVGSKCELHVSMMQLINILTCWRSWCSDSGVAEGSGLLGCEAVSLGEWILACRKVVVPSKRRKLLVNATALQSRRNFPHDMTHCEYETSSAVLDCAA